MSVIVNMHKAKSDLSGLVAQALAGEDVIITQDGKPVVRLTPIRERIPGLDKGKIHIADDFDDPLPEDLLRAFEGG